MDRRNSSRRERPEHHGERLDALRQQNREPSSEAPYFPLSESYQSRPSSRRGRRELTRPLQSRESPLVHRLREQSPIRGQPLQLYETTFLERVIQQLRLREQSLSQETLEPKAKLKNLLDRCYTGGYHQLSPREQHIMNNAIDVCDDLNAEVARADISPAEKEQRSEMVANIILGGNRTEYRRRVTDEEKHSDVYRHLENQFYAKWEAKNSEDGLHL